MQTKSEYGINYKLNKSREGLKVLIELGIDYNYFDDEKKNEVVYSFNKKLKEHF